MARTHAFAGDSAGMFVRESALELKPTTERHYDVGPSSEGKDPKWNVDCLSCYGYHSSAP